MNKLLKIGVIFSLCFTLLVGMSLSVGALSLNLAVNTITGTVFIDTDRNGVFDAKSLDIALPNMGVTLFTSLQDAQSGKNATKSTVTNVLGAYIFSSLKQGTYYLSYANEPNVQAITQKNSVEDSSGNVTPGIVKVEINKNLIVYQDLAMRKVTNLTMTPFNDTNVNGVMDSGETIPAGKTMIFLDVLKTKDMIESGAFKDIDVAGTLLKALGGNVDFKDAIFFRTTSAGQKITIPDVDSGLYIMMRSPFNLTVKNLLVDAGRISGLFNLLQTGNPAMLISEMPSLLDTGDITTTPNNTFIKLLASTLTKAMDGLDKIEVESYLGQNIDSQKTALSGTVRFAAALLNQLPAMRFVAVDRWGGSYDLTDLKVVKTSEFFFGIREYVSITGTVYSDNNANGKKDTLEPSKSVKLTAYDAKGKVLGTVTTPSLLGNYTIEKLPYDTNIYLALGSDEPFSPHFNKDVPTALNNLNIVGVYNIPSDSPYPEISQDIGIISVTNLGLQLKSQNDAQKSAVVTVINKNYSSYTIEYSVNDGQVYQTTINAKGLLTGDAKKDITLTDLSTGVNTVKVRWLADIYSGSYVKLSFTIG